MFKVAYKTKKIELNFLFFKVMFFTDFISNSKRLIQYEKHSCSSRRIMAAMLAKT